MITKRSRSRIASEQNSPAQCPARVPILYEKLYDPHGLPNTNRDGPGVNNVNKLKCRLITIFVILAVVLLPQPNEWLHRSSRSILRPLMPVGPGVRDKAVLQNEAFWIALQFFRSHRLEFKNRRYITIIDYTKPSTAERLFLIDMESGEVQKTTVSHGRNSGWLYATRFSNDPESFLSSRGFFRTGGKYYGKLGACLQLHGLEKGVNDNALSRGIIMHGAHYAGPESIRPNRGRLGRSLGCPAIPMEAVENVIDRIKDGSLLYIHGKTRGGPQVSARR